MKLILEDGILNKNRNMIAKRHTRNINSFMNSFLDLHHEDLSSLSLEGCHSSPIIEHKHPVFDLIHKHMEKNPHIRFWNATGKRDNRILDELYDMVWMFLTSTSHLLVAVNMSTPFNQLKHEKQDRFNFNDVSGVEVLKSLWNSPKNQCVLFKLFSEKRYDEMTPFEKFEEDNIDEIKRKHPDDGKRAIREILRKMWEVEKVKQEKKKTLDREEYKANENRKLIEEQEALLSKYKNANDMYIKNIETRRDIMETGENSDDLEHCCICMESLGNGEENKIMACGHVYHRDCIDKWTKKHSSCPTCRDLSGAQWKKIDF